MGSRSRIVLPPAYLGSVSYYVCLLNFPTEIEQFSNYSRQTYFNRCRIASANGVMDLTIPVENPTQKTWVRDIRISNHGNWQMCHWRAIEAAYFSSPFFEFYQDDFRPFYTKKYRFLFDFNRELQKTVLNIIDLPYQITYTENYEKNLPEGVIDFREMMHPKKNNVTLQDYFKLKPYYQVFEQKHGFLSDLSIIDLLFNMGTEARLILKNNIK